MNLVFECLYDGRALTGESPVWDAPNNALWWVDITAKTVFRMDMASRAVRSWTMPAVVAAVALTDDERIAVALPDGIYLFHTETKRLDKLVDPEPERPTNRLNDAKVGPDGAYWVGSMDDRPSKEPVGALHRVTRDGRSTRMVEGLTIANGLAWSADGRTMFLTDTRGPWIDRWDFDPSSGAISNRTRIAVLSNEDGRPDGGAADMDGGYWSAGVSAACLNRFDRNGLPTAKVPLPFKRPTMVAFGGPDMRTMFVTCQAENRPVEEFAGPYPAGGLFAARVEIPGVAVGRFR